MPVQADFEISLQALSGGRVLCRRQLICKKPVLHPLSPTGKVRAHCSNAAADLWNFAAGPAGASARSTLQLTSGSLLQALLGALRRCWGQPVPELSLPLCQLMDTWTLQVLLGAHG